MERSSLRELFQLGIVLAGPLVFSSTSYAHVTLQPNQPLRPGGFAEVTMMVPNERGTDTVRVSLEMPDAFLKAGGRLSRVEFPAGWRVVIDKENKPDEIYAQEMQQRATRGGDHLDAQTSQQQKEQEVLNEMRRKWIKKVTFEGSIPPDGFKPFLLDFQLPNAPGEYRFASIQTYADGTDVSWSELVKGAPHPAPSLVLRKEQAGLNFETGTFILSGLALLLSFVLLLDRLRRGGTPQMAVIAPVEPLAAGSKIQ